MAPNLTVVQHIYVVMYRFLAVLQWPEVYVNVAPLAEPEVVTALQP